MLLLWLLTGHNININQTYESILPVVYVLLGKAVTEYRWGGSRNILFMRHKIIVLTVKTLLKSVYIYGRYGKIKTGVSLFWTTWYVLVLALEVMDREAHPLGLTINWTKTKIQNLGDQDGANQLQYATIGGNQVEVVLLSTS